MANDSSYRTSDGDTIKRKRQLNEIKTNNSIVSSLQLNLEFKSIIILAQGWPSWVYSISGLFGNTNIFVSSNSPVIGSFYRHLFDNNFEWWSWNSWRAKAKSRGICGPILFCIQGAPSFGDDIFSTILALDQVIEKSCIFALDFVGSIDVPRQSQFMYLNDHKYLTPIIARHGYSSLTTSHFQCGGNTKDKRRIIAIKGERDLIKLNNSSVSKWNSVGSTLRRYLFHDLDLSQQGRSKLPIPRSTPIFNSEDIIPISVLKSCWLKVPCIFSKSPVYRHLSMKEILNMKDLPVDMIRRMEKDRRNVSKDLLDLIILAAPSKILWESIIFYFMKPSKLSSSSAENPNQSKRVKFTDEILSFDDLLKYSTDQSNDSEEMEVTESGVAVKAVKGDDAEAEQRKWNEILFQRCLSEKYVHEIHAPMLDAVRSKFIMTWYYRNIYKSFRKYLRFTYGEELVQSFIHERDSIAPKRGAKAKKLGYSRDVIDEFLKDLEAGREILYRCIMSSYW